MEETFKEVLSLILWIFFLQILYLASIFNILFFVWYSALKFAIISTFFASAILCSICASISLILTASHASAILISVTLFASAIFLLRIRRSLALSLRYFDILSFFSSDRCK